MSLIDLIKYVDQALTEQHSVVLDEDQFRRISKLPIGRMTREVANNAAWAIVHHRPRFYASSEAFLDNESLEEIRVYLVAARSQGAYEVRVAKLREQVLGELGGELGRYQRYEHNSAKEQDEPAPLVTPPPASEVER